MCAYYSSTDWVLHCGLGIVGEVMQIRVSHDICVAYLAGFTSANLPSRGKILDWIGDFTASFFHSL